MLHTPPSAQMIAAAAARGFSSPPTSLSPISNPTPSSSNNPNSNSNSPISVDPRGWSGNANVGGNGIGGIGSPYTLNPLQQREAMQREAWEKERNSLLKKASNAQGDSVERLVRAYLAV
jgi:hypothetical protein